jgi:hypothetical protein
MTPDAVKRDRAHAPTTKADFHRPGVHSVVQHPVGEARHRTAHEQGAERLQGVRRGTGCHQNVA